MKGMTRRGGFFALLMVMLVLIAPGTRSAARQSARSKPGRIVGVEWANLHIVPKDARKGLMSVAFHVVLEADAKEKIDFKIELRRIDEGVRLADEVKTIAQTLPATGRRIKFVIHPELPAGVYLLRIVSPGSRDQFATLTVDNHPPLSIPKRPIFTPIISVRPPSLTPLRAAPGDAIPTEVETRDDVDARDSNFTVIFRLFDPSGNRVWIRTDRNLHVGWSVHDNFDLYATRNGRSNGAPLTVRGTYTLTAVRNRQGHQEVPMPVKIQ